MPKKPGPPQNRTEPSVAGGYLSVAKRPLQVLIFLLPLILAYELCLALLLPPNVTVEAHERLLGFFAAFGVAPTGGLYLGGLVIVVVLLAWHVLAREQWRIEPAALGLMAIESLLLALPLLVLGRVITCQHLITAGSAPMAFADLDVGSQLAISIGAGLYEELIFRMVLIAVIHTLLVDAGRLRHWVGATIAIVISAAAFTWYHDLSGAAGGVSGQKVAFLFLAGLYFGAIFASRGFGIVVGAHAIYDIIVVLIPSPGAG